MQDPGRHLGIEFACSAELFIEGVLLIGERVDLVLQTRSCRPAGRTARCWTADPDPSATPMANARNTAASEIACERREITCRPSK